MDTGKKLLLSLLQALENEHVLKDLIIIGGWCLLIYREHYGNPSLISSIRTADIDFLVATDKKFTYDIDINEVFRRDGFDRVFSSDKGYIKYVHPDLEAEFLVPLTGRPVDRPYPIAALRTNAQRLRFLDILAGIQNTFPIWAWMSGFLNPLRI